MIIINKNNKFHVILKILLLVFHIYSIYWFYNNIDFSKSPNLQNYATLILISISIFSIFILFSPFVPFFQEILNYIFPNIIFDKVNVGIFIIVLTLVHNIVLYIIIEYGVEFLSILNDILTTSLFLIVIFFKIYIKILNL